MQYRRLGRTNLNVSVIGFGTAQLRLVSEKQAVETLKTALNAGVNLIHTAPDYEGAEDLIVKALAETMLRRKVYVCSQGWGEVSHFERQFESTCEKLGTEKLDMFGIAALSDREYLGENIWHRGGVVEFLQKKKEEGRIRGLFCTTHGPPHHIKEVIKRDVFDALMISYNVLGFHLLSYNPDNLWDFAQSPVEFESKWEFEDISKVRNEIFPMAKEWDIGLMIMKPLAGGLLCSSKTFPPRTDPFPEQKDLTAADLIRYILMNPEVSCVVPGTASVEEAEENSGAGKGRIALTPEKMVWVESKVAHLVSLLCSRCGACDTSCSRNLPVSWLFRAAYISLFPSETFELWDEVQYFTLHPAVLSNCSTCDNMTCECPRNIDIPRSLSALHEKMVDLMEGGLVMYPPGRQFRPSTPKHRGMAVITRDIPKTAVAGEPIPIRLWLENTGLSTWHAAPAEGHSSVLLAVSLDNCHICAVPLRTTVHRGERAHFSFDIEAPRETGKHRLRLDLFEHEVAFISDERGEPVESDIMVVNTSSAYAVSYLKHNIPGSVQGDARLSFWVEVQNTGTATWFRDLPDGRFVGLAAYINGIYKATARSMRDEVLPGEKTSISIIIDFSDIIGECELKLDMVAHEITMFEEEGSEPLCLRLHVKPHDKNHTEELIDVALAHNYFFFWPGGRGCVGRGRSRYPVFAKKAKGCRITDTAGDTYIDYIMGWGCALLGYANDRIQGAVSRALDSAAIIPIPHELEIKVAQKLCTMLPSAEMALFGKNGSDVCTAAVRMARAYTGKSKILFRGYHGWQDWFFEHQGLQDVGPADCNEPLLIPFPYDDVEALNRIMREHDGEVAAVMLEPAAPVEGFQGPIRDAGGGYLSEVARIARKHGALLIFDEIITGFRYHCGSVQQATGIVPDLTCLGKGLSAGMPLSALVGKRRIFDQTIHRIGYTPTFKGEVYSLAAAWEALKIYEEIDVPGYIYRNAERFRKALNNLYAASDLNAELAGPPFRMITVFHDPDYERVVLLRTLLQQELIKKGVITFKCCMLPSYAHDEAVYDTTLAAFEHAISVIEKASKSDSILKYLEIPENE